MYLHVHNYTYTGMLCRVKELRGGGRQVVMAESPPVDAEPSVHGDADDLPYVCTVCTYILNTCTCISIYMYDQCAVVWMCTLYNIHVLSLG